MTPIESDILTLIETIRYELREIWSVEDAIQEQLGQIANNLRLIQNTNETESDH